MLTGIPAVSGYRARSAATRRAYPEAGPGRRTSLPTAATVIDASASDSGPASSGGRAGRPCGSRAAFTSRATGANAASLYSAFWSACRSRFPVSGVEGTSVALGRRSNSRASARISGCTSPGRRASRSPSASRAGSPAQTAKSGKRSAARHHDYEVFLLSRIHEAWVRTGDARASVAHVLEITARVITCAALIMVSVFAAFVISDNIVVKMLGLGLRPACSSTPPSYGCCSSRR